MRRRQARDHTPHFCECLKLGASRGRSARNRCQACVKAIRRRCEGKLSVARSRWRFPWTEICSMSCARTATRYALSTPNPAPSSGRFMSDTFRAGSPFPRRTAALCHQRLVRHGFCHRRDLARESFKRFPPDSNRPELSSIDSGETLYVANRLSSDVSVIDLATGREIKRLLAGRGASYLALSPDGKLIYCTHIYPNPGHSARKPNLKSPSSIPTRQGGGTQTSAQRRRRVSCCASADGKLGVAAQLRPKNLIPLAHVEHGWVFGDSLTLFGEDVGRTVQIPIDELDRYYALPWGVAITPDKSKIFLTDGGIRERHRDRHFASC